MWSHTIAATSWAFGWFLICTAVFWVGQARLKWFLAKQTYGLLWLLSIAFLVRLLPTLLLPVGATYDIDSFLLVGRALLAGQEVYTSEAIGRHPYLPMQMYAIGAALWAAAQTAVPFVVWIKLLPVLADVGITAVVFRASIYRYNNLDTAYQHGLLFALNPISLLVTAFHGQFDAVAVLLLLSAWYLYQLHHFTRSAMMLGFAILNKSWPIVLLPILFLRTWKRPRLIWPYTAMAVAIPALFTLLYLLAFDADPMPMLRRALTHTGVAGYWGHSALLAVAARVFSWLEPLYEGLLLLNRPLLVVVGLLTLWQTRFQDSLNVLVTVILAEFAVSVGMGIQWLLWVVPFAIVAHDLQWLRLYSMMGSLFLLGQLYGIHMYPWAFQLFGQEMGDIVIRLSSVPAWVTVVLWAEWRLRKGVATQVPKQVL